MEGNTWSRFSKNATSKRAEVIEIIQYVWCFRAAAFERDSGEVIMECLKAIVKGPAVGQAAKGILTAGAYKTVLYSYAKLVKMVKSYSVGLGTDALFSIYCLVGKN